MLARYRTERGAARYAREIMTKFPSVKASPQIIAWPADMVRPYGVMVVVPGGRFALADKRPRNYMNDPWHHRIASKALEQAGY